MTVIQTVVADCDGLSRDELALTVCELLGWTRATGRLKGRECRELLERLEAAGLITLPTKRIGRPVGSRTTVPYTSQGAFQPALTGSVRSLQPVMLERTRTAGDRQFFRELIERHHYLGHAVPFGAHLQYLVYSGRAQRQVVACVQCSSAAWRMACRDAWIGWDDATRLRHLPRVVNNSRFLILPWVQVPHLASTILGRLARQIVVDWPEAYGVRPVLLETLVDPARFAGTSYRAANWIAVGMTTGRGRTGPAGPRAARVPKRVFLYPLSPHARQQLRGY